MEQLGFDERGGCGVQPVAFGRVQLACFGQQVTCFIGFAQQSEGSAVTGEGAGAFGTHAHLGECLRQARGGGRRLGGQVQLEVGIGHLELGGRRQVRHAQRGVCAPHMFEVIERAIVAALEHRQAAQVVADVGLSELEADPLGAGQRLLERCAGFGEPKLLQQHFAKEGINLYQLWLALDPGIALACCAVELLGLLKSAATVRDDAQVLLDLARRHQVPVRFERTPRCDTARDGFVVTAERRQTLQHADLRRGHVQRLPEGGEALSSLIQQRDAALHVAFEVHGGHAARPGSQRSDLRLINRSAEEVQGCGGLRRLCRLASARFLVKRVQLARQSAIGVGRVLAQQSFAFGRVALDQSGGEPPPLHLPGSSHGPAARTRHGPAALRALF